MRIFSLFLVFVSMIVASNSWGVPRHLGYILVCFMLFFTKIAVPPPCFELGRSAL